MTNDPTDAELAECLEKWRAGDQGARDSIFAYMLDWSRELVPGHRAKRPDLAKFERPSDIMQEAMIKLLNQYERHPDVRPATPNELRSHVARASLDVSLDLTRKHRGPHAFARNFDGQFADDHAEDLTSVTSQAIREEEIKKALAEIDLLPDDEQVVIRLMILGGLSTKGVADLCNVNPRTVLKRETRALLKLADRLDRAFGLTPPPARQPPSPPPRTDRDANPGARPDQTR
jgi:RNA polymerase sigma factor (sigma-70 family)